MALRFKNLDGSGPQPFNTVFKWAFLDKVTGKRRKSPDRAPVPRVEPDLATLATPPAPGEGARLTWLGHASWLVQLDGVSLLVDPVLRDAINVVIHRNVPPGVPVEKLPPISASLVSHNHYDHLDLPTLQGVGAPIVTGLGHERVFRGSRLPVTELDWWRSTQVGPVTVHFVPSQHWSRRGLNDVNEMLWGGFVIEGSSARVYHSGDTAYFEGFREIGRRFPDLDAALLPIGAYDPAWFMSRQHMNPEEAAQSFEDLGARQFLAMHWGTFKLTDEPLDEPPVRLNAEWSRRGWPSERLHVLAVGASLTVRRG
ncbi:MBL fold metallo-hydrolase [Corallococcus sp. H22C18031201]|uniref:MBL fold metallo-hydrolase n=1 Tax=Citreicoccus inhibens TaxID=2849499 RepID=UPI000E750F17|nr:MBL fold metallo-hydrolase [Citreicoccus inhibens]MBU8896394.1 MBL fold metallo-hydrolase [Citreicoccus inhibens]RJS24221.1 MBL fold metallo-hydrolase [Corallococcus sp. H22C18031201]